MPSFLPPLDRIPPRIASGGADAIFQACTRSRTALSSSTARSSSARSWSSRSPTTTVCSTGGKRSPSSVRRRPRRCSIRRLSAVGWFCACSQGPGLPRGPTENAAHRMRGRGRGGRGGKWYWTVRTPLFGRMHALRTFFCCRALEPFSRAQGELEMDPAVLIFADIPNSRYYLSYSMRLFLAVSCLSISQIVVHRLACEVCVQVSLTHHTRSPSGSRLLRP